MIQCNKVNSTEKSEGLQIKQIFILLENLFDTQYRGAVVCGRLQNV